MEISDRIFELKENIDGGKCPFQSNEIDLTKAKFYTSIDSLIGDNMYKIFETTVINIHNFFNGNCSKNVDEFKKRLLKEFKDLKSTDKYMFHDLVNNNEALKSLDDSPIAIYSMFVAVNNLNYFKNKDFTGDELYRNEFVQLFGYFKLDEIKYAINFINYAEFDLSITELDAVYIMSLIGLVVKEKIDKKEHFDIVLSLSNDNIGYIADNGFNSYLKKEINS